MDILVLLKLIICLLSGENGGLRKISEINEAENQKRMQPAVMPQSGQVAAVHYVPEILVDNYYPLIIFNIRGYLFI